MRIRLSGEALKRHRQTLRECIDELVAKYGWRAPWIQEREQLRQVKVPASFLPRSEWPDDELSRAAREQEARGKGGR